MHDKIFNFEMFIKFYEIFEKNHVCPQDGEIAYYIDYRRGIGLRRPHTPVPKRVLLHA